MTKISIKSTVLYIVALMISALSFQTNAQNSVSIGTEEINENAVLRLVSPGNNQGLLLPRLTTAHRESMNLAEEDNGMLVYDNDKQMFYYWHNGQWYPLSANSQVPVIKGAGGTKVTGTYPDITIYSSPNDTLPTNEIQDLRLNGNNLSITGNASATNIDLSMYLDNTDSQSLSLTGNNLEISGGNTVDLSSLNGWGLNGNTGTNPANNYLGTSDNSDLSIRTGGVERMRFNAATGDADIIQNLTTGQSISSGNTYDITSGNQFMYANTQTRYKTCPASSIITSGTISFCTSYANNFSQEAYIPLDLPEGGRLTQFQVRVYDSDPNSDIEASIVYIDLTDDTEHGMNDLVMTSGTPGLTTLTYDFPVGFPIDSNYGFFFVLHLHDNLDHRFYWARVTYTVQKAD
jgi:hypothetical protein